MQKQTNSPDFLSPLLPSIVSTQRQIRGEIRKTYRCLREEERQAKCSSPQPGMENFCQQTCQEQFITPGNKEARFRATSCPGPVTLQQFQLQKSVFTENVLFTTVTRNSSLLQLKAEAGAQEAFHKSIRIDSMIWA